MFQPAARLLLGAEFSDVVALDGQPAEAALERAGLRRRSPRLRSFSKALGLSGSGSATHNMTILAPLSKHRLPQQFGPITS